MNSRNAVTARIFARAACTLLAASAAAACSPEPGYQIGPAYSDYTPAPTPAPAPAPLLEPWMRPIGIESSVQVASRGGDAAEILMRRLEALNPDDDRAALRLLGAYGAARPAKSPEAIAAIVSQLRAALESQRHQVRRGALAALSRIDPQELRCDPFAPFFADPDPEVRRQAVLGRLRIGVGTAWTDVLKCSYDADDSVRTAAATTLGAVRHEKAAARLIELLADPEPGVVSAAGFALERCLAGEVPPDLIAYTDSDRCEARVAAARVLGAGRGVRAVRSLRPLIDDPNWRVRREAIRGLAGIAGATGEAGAEATAGLTVVARDKVRPFADRLDAIQALARTVSRPDLDALLLAAGTEADPVLRLALARTILARGDARAAQLVVDLTEFATLEPARQQGAARIRALADFTLRDAFENDAAAPAGVVRVIRTRTWREKLPGALAALGRKPVDYTPAPLDNSGW